MQDTEHRTNELVRFGERFGRFAPVWLVATKSKSPDGGEINNNLVDLVDILSRDKIADAGALAPVRARALSFLPSERIDQIDQIGFGRHAVPRISFGSKEPNPTNGPTKSGLNWLVGGFEEGWSA
jgi:hypothetical protein